MTRILLLSNSIQFGSGFLDHAESEITDFLRGVTRVAFVPFAAFDLDDYADRVARRFAPWNITISSVHRRDGSRVIDDAEAIFIGGGNTFRLLTRLYETKLLHRIAARVRDGIPFLGSSAGSIVAGPSLKTTKDMPVLEPESFSALGIVPFHISPHYLDPDPSSRHMGETQEERILQFLEENEGRVVGLREGTMLRVEGESVTLKGPSSARLFQRGAPPGECPPGAMPW
ncbi:MAG TPA: dipeptidase PepE [Thermoanaerobaculia bacterium]|jgi:dipeptidase E|nr:dipeptidase PepE [Thermoanaerobaculia bacterium]